MRMCGLEHHNGVYNLEMYITGYTCKGNAVSRSWKEVLKTITNEYCSCDCNSEKNVKSPVAKHMNEIAGSMTIPRDQASYICYLTG